MRRTTTIAAGAIGNERALVATTEEWDVARSQDAGVVRTRGSAERHLHL